MSTMWQMCFLVAVLMMCSVSGRGTAKLKAQAQGGGLMGSIGDSKGQGTVCGQKQIQTSKRDDEKGGLNNYDDSDHLDKIFGGHDVTHGDVPWQAGYYSNGSHVCGGVIIGEYWVLTAISCVYYSHESPYLVVGDNRQSQSDAGQQRVEIGSILYHELYNRIPQFAGSAFDYDIALLKLKPKNGRGILFNNYVQPICLPGSDENIRVGDSLTVSGWGDDTTEFHRTTDVLRKVVITVMNQQECRSVLQPGALTDHMLCASIRPDSGVCLGDYGGPATYKIGDLYFVHDTYTSQLDQNVDFSSLTWGRKIKVLLKSQGVRLMARDTDSHILVGLLIGSSLCQRPRDLVVLTNILSYRYWIKEVIKLHSSNTEGLIPSRRG